MFIRLGSDPENALCLVALVCTGAVHAQAPTGGAASALEQIVVSATALPTQYAKVGSSLTVIDSSQIEAGGYTFVPDVLRQVPGLAINRSGSFGGPTLVRTRGAEGNHTIVLFNGVDVSDAGQGETDLSTLLTVNVDRIEVLRGPQSGLYGSNALAGVINILTPRDNVGASYRASGEVGSFSVTSLLGGGGFGNGESYLDGGFGLQETAGIDMSALGAINGPPGVADDKEGYRNITGYLTAGVKFSPVLRFDGFARYVDSRADFDGFDFSFIPGRQGRTYDDASEASTQSYNLAGSGTLSLFDARWVTNLYASHTNNHAEGKDGIAGDEYGDKAHRTNFGIKSSFRTGANGLVNTLTFFAESKKESYLNTHPFSPAQGETQSRDLAGLGLQDQLEIAGQLYLSGSYRHDDNDKFDNVDTYSLAASWVVSATGTRPHASYGKGVTNPTFFEQFGFDPGSYVGNPDLKPESAKGWDLGVEQSFAGGRALLDVTYFRSTLHDEIVSCFPSSCNETGESNREGLEVSARIAPTAAIDVIGSYTYLRAREGNPSTVEVRRPGNQAALDATWRLASDSLRLTLGATYNGEQFDNDFRQYGLPSFVALKSKVPSYTIVRLAAGFKVSPRFEVLARVENALDEHYEESLGYRAPGAAAYVGVRLTGGSAD
ncbi:MAG: TonB-dependent receptor [Pseudomonadota bacterium]